MSSFINRLTPTAQQVNLARRWTVQNENDLLQEDLFDDSLDWGSRSYNRESCVKLVPHLMHFKDMPRDCAQYEDLVSEVKRRDSDTTHPSSILS